jgi:hypothetical protein
MQHSVAPQISAQGKQSVDTLQKMVLRAISDQNLTDEQITPAIEKAVPKIADSLLLVLKQKAPEMLDRRRQSDIGFRQRNFDRWCSGFNLLEMLIVIAAETGSDFNNEFRPRAVREGNFTFEALTALHSKALLISNEILCLLKNGFPDGAHARWRSLHEVATTAVFLRQHDQKTAKRYVLAERVQDYAAMCQYQQYAERAGMEPFSEAEVTTAREMREAIIEKHGSPLKNEYGWAYSALPNIKPSFRDLEKSVGLDHWRPRFKWASQHTHSNFSAARKLLGMVEAKKTVLLIGPSNSGLTDPAAQTALSLVHATVSLLSIESTLDHAILMQVLTKLAQEVGEEFLKSQQKQALR